MWLGVGRYLLSIPRVFGVGRSPDFVCACMVRAASIRSYLLDYVSWLGEVLFMVVLSVGSTIIS